MQLSVKNRMVLFALINGATGDLNTLRAIRKFKQDIMITQEEKEALELKTENGSITWNVEKDQAVEVVVDPLVHKVIVNKLVAMNTANPPLLQDYHVEVYELFVEGTNG